MSEIRNLTCINCPLGCQIEVTMDGGAVLDVKGNSCPRGDRYARKEVTNPTRIVTSSVRVSGSSTGAVTVSVKTASDIPKPLIFDVIKSLKGISVPCPVRIGDVIVPNVCDTGVNVIATKNVV